MHAALLRLFLSMLLLVLLLPLPGQAQTTFTVTTPNDSGPGSLRQAILDLNAGAGSATIAFNLPGSGPHVLRPQSELPALKRPVVLDGLTQPGAGCDTWPPTLQIVLDGAQAGFAADGITLDVGSAGSTVRGLVISRFGDDGLDIESNDNVVECSFVGTDVSGTQRRGNGTGILIDGTAGNRIGGTSASQRNLISGNLLNGIEVEPNSSFTGNRVQGNYIGTDVTGMLALGNAEDGVLIDRASYTTVGGETPAARNVISGNGDDGIDIYGAEARSNVVQHNYIGVAADGRTALGNLEDGMDLNEQPEANQIYDNVIGANADWGIYINSGARETIVARNFIGTNPEGDRLGNGLGGLLAKDSGPQIIGGTYGPEDDCCEGNTVAFNGGPGIGVKANVSVSYEKGIRGNRIYENAGLGIDLELDGVTPNDPLDRDGGGQANRLQNFPVLAPPEAGRLDVAATLNSAPNASFRVDLYANEACDPSGYGEGQHFIGTAGVQTNGAGDAAFSVEVDAALAQGTVLTATATDGDGNTSEFSACVVVTAPANRAPSPSTITQPAAGATVVVGGAPGMPPRDPGASITVAWSAASDPDGDAITYAWQLATDAAFANVLTSRQTASATAVTFTLGELAAVLDAAGVTLGSGVTLYHRAVASDGEAETAGPGVQVTLVRGTLVGVEDEALPAQFALEAAYPNPFNPATTVAFALPAAAQVRLAVYDALGREVAVLADGTRAAGRHRVVFEAGALPSGLYLVRLAAGSFSQTRHMLLVK